MAGGPETSELTQGERRALDPREQSGAPSLRPFFVVAVVAVCLGALLATVLAIFDAAASTVGQHVVQALQIIAAGLFLGSGVLRMARWRIAHDTRSLIMGVALITFGGMVIPLTSLAGIIMGDDPTSLLRAATSVATTSVSLTLVLWAVSGRSAVTTRARWILLGGIGAVAAVFVGLVAVHSWSPSTLHSETVDPRLLRGSVLAVLWTYVGFEAAVRSDVKPWAGRLAPLLGCLGVAELLGVIGVYHSGGWQLAAAALVACVAGITTHRALMDLDEATTAGDLHLQALTDALDHSRAGISKQHEWREELVHDARNALAGLKAALVTLERYDGVLDPATSERLRTAALGEISHLEHLIIRSDRDDTVDFDLDEVLAAVVETRRAAGLDVGYTPCGLRAHGRPGDLATALQNLLVNAQTHGGGNAAVQAVNVAGRVEVYVTDRGPGLSPSQVATLFQRGARGPQSRGSGLGLHVSRTLMHQQGGDLQLRCATGGAVFALVLPASRAAAKLAALPDPTRVRRPRLVQGALSATAE
jgi:signal transduction histidine kinase